MGAIGQLQRIVRPAKRLAAAALALAMSLVAVWSAFASEGTQTDMAVDFDSARQGSITVRLLDSETGSAVSGGMLGVYRVGDVVSDGGLFAFTLTEEFSASGVDLFDLRAEGLATHLLSYALDNQVSTLQQMGFDDAGAARFEGLQVGLYLVAQIGSGDGYYPVTPFLACVPMTSEDGTSWIYDVNASPKVQAVPFEPQTTSLAVSKVWKGAATTPSSVKVNLLRDGTVHETVTLSNSNNWAYTWEGLDGSHGWSVAEANVPAGYTASYAISGSGRTTVITNTADVPSTPPDKEEKLIQTGQLNWPVPVLAAAGLGLLVVGWAVAHGGQSRKDADAR